MTLTNEWIFVNIAHWEFYDRKTQPRSKLTNTWRRLLSGSGWLAVVLAFMVLGGWLWACHWVGVSACGCPSCKQLNPAVGNPEIGSQGTQGVSLTGQWMLSIVSVSDGFWVVHRTVGGYRAVPWGMGARTVVSVLCKLDFPFVQQLLRNCIAPNLLIFVSWSEKFCLLLFWKTILPFGNSFQKSLSLILNEWIFVK